MFKNTVKQYTKLDAITLPIVLLHLLKWLKANSDISIQILLRKGGGLESAFEAVAPVFIFNSRWTKVIRILIRLLNYLGLGTIVNAIYLKRLKKYLLKEKFNLVYVNTVANSDVMEFLSDLDCPTICHVHELDYAIGHIGLEGFEKVKRNTNHFIAVSEAVKNNLVENHNISSNKIEVIYGCIPAFPNLKNVQEARKQLFEQLNIPDEAKIICASGTPSWRKGSDLFIQLAHSIYKQDLNFPVYFLWVGGDNSKSYFDELCYDVNKLGLKKYVHFLGIQKNPLDLFAICDVFTLMSREDPFPLVCLEAASQGKPIVCFDNAGGEKEFVEDDCGFVVPYLDIETMALKIVNLLSSPELCQRLGQRARQKVQERHDVDITGPKILKLIQQFL